ncbi:DUF1320 domain-containing protein [Hymenobacter sp. 15J16-1T3B]|uniref:phage protein Gp36 family protein n=1 Tax=Hymenobacter sp. 15J16-1T3B TaxID=2886941 RepID=UPI001D11B5C3|nr:phage protein Gp36 family protein [Hymenobacter sp. 15J16-1T3B]MCC3159507.1 DUF1320 domain-containing protein [Hymenobacter sp. 15J16-1T3B]
MAFLTPEDYGTQIRTEQLHVITDEDGTVLPKAELYAQQLCESYLRSRYDVAAIFAATGDDRSALLVTYMVDISLYTVHSRHGRAQMPEKRIVRYDQALEWLKAIGKGSITADLPLLPPAERPGGFKWGSAPKQTLSW